ncbi:hypothetical protein GLOIN_2v1844752 [Rhizophagus irregularis DAOM 181602=DAOM 197198]|nr:hypothetical protein GLOIN_2v1844752 [Rhizophagus irregularis DAOM 181602=DAOM 197198]
MGRETQIGLFTTGANGMNFFVKSKPKVVRRWREETLKQFVYGNHGRMTEDNTDEIEKFRCGLLLQGEDSITEYYSEVKRCNDVVKLCKDHLKNVFINELENKNSVLIKFGYNHPLDITIIYIVLLIDNVFLLSIRSMPIQRGDQQLKRILQRSKVKDRLNKQALYQIYKPPPLKIITVNKNCINQPGVDFPCEK